MKKFTLYLLTAMTLGSQAFIANAQEAHDLPYINHITSQEEFDEFLIDDRSFDGNTWQFTDELEEGTAAQYRYSIMTPANDYLITPYFKVEAGEEYELMFDYYHSNYMNCYENLEVRFGYDRSVEGLTQQILDMPNLDPNFGALWRPKSVRFKATETGNGCIGFRVYSEPDQNVLRLRNIVVRHVSDNDLRVISFFGSDVAYVNEPIMHRVEVINTGKSTVTGAKVQIKSDLDDSVLGETVIESIAADETQLITVEWTPSAKKAMDIYAYIDLGADTYKDDNTSVRVLDVDVRNVDGDRLYSIGYPDEDGYRPIFTYYNYSIMETIYYAKDFIFESMDITGMQYVHIPAEEIDPRMASVPVKVYMMNTDLDEMPGILSVCDVALSLDTDMTGAEKAGYATLIINGMDTDLVSSCVEYVKDGSSLILKGVTVGDGYKGNITQDLEFTMLANGTIRCKGEFSGNSQETSYIKVYLTGTILNPVTDGNYTGQAQMDTKHYLPEEDYTLVFNGNIDASGRLPLNLVNFNFSTPFQYTGGNVAVKVISDRNYYLPLVEWLIVNETDLNLPIRSFFNGTDDKSLVTGGKMAPAPNTHIPFLRFFYKNGDTSVMTVGNNASLTVNKYADNLLFNMTCDDVYVYSIAGNLLLKASNTDMLSLASLQAGVYIVRGVANGEAVTLKIVK